MQWRNGEDAMLEEMWKVRADVQVHPKCETAVKQLEWDDPVGEQMMNTPAFC